jgi:hypothetical protein
VLTADPATIKKSTGRTAGGFIFNGFDFSDRVYQLR